MLIDMVEGMLSNVTDNHVRMSPNLTAVRLQVTKDKLDKSGFARTVGTENCNTRGEGDLKGDITKLRLTRARILEANMAPGISNQYLSKT